MRLQTLITISSITLLLLIVSIIPVIAYSNIDTNLADNSNNVSLNNEGLTNNSIAVPYNTSSLKFVTVNSPSWGEVTVREDMVVKNGDEISIIPNNNFKTEGLITPKVNKPLEFSYVTINTIYGRLKVPSDKYYEKGNEKIVKEFYAFVEKINNLKSANDNVVKNNGPLNIMGIKNKVDENNTTIVSQNSCEGQSLNDPLVYERAAYYRINANQYPDYLYGHLNPAQSNNVIGLLDTSYDERELYLHNTNNGNWGIIEFISQYKNNGNRDVWISLFNNSWSGDVLHVSNNNNPMDYYLFVDSSQQEYELYLIDTVNWICYYTYFHDVNSYSNFIDWYAGSTELYFNLPIGYDFSTSTSFTDYSMAIGSTYYSPNQLFRLDHIDTDMPYVYTNAYTDGNGYITTEHKTQFTSINDYAHVETHVLYNQYISALTDYQIKIIVHKGSGIDYGQDVYLNNQAQSWNNNVPNDIRFTNNNNVLLPYWIESSDANTATVWVKVDTIPAYPGSVTIKLFYGRSSDIGASDGTRTFIFYDQLTNLDQWSTSQNPAVTTSDNKMNIPAGGYAMTANSFDTRNTAFRCRIYLAAGSNWEKYFGWGGDTAYYIAPIDGCGIWNDWGPMYQRLQYGSGQGMTVPLPVAQWDIYDMYLNNYGNYAYVYKNGAQILDGSVSCSQTLKWMMSNHWQCGGTYQLDWLFVRNKVINEPTHGAWN